MVVNTFVGFVRVAVRVFPVMRVRRNCMRNQMKEGISQKPP